MEDRSSRTYGDIRSGLTPHSPNISLTLKPSYDKDSKTYSFCQRLRTFYNLCALRYLYGSFVE